MCQHASRPFTTIDDLRNGGRILLAATLRLNATLRLSCPTTIVGGVLDGGRPLQRAGAAGQVFADRRLPPEHLHVKMRHGRDGALVDLDHCDRLEEGLRRAPLTLVYPGMPWNRPKCAVRAVRRARECELQMSQPCHGRVRQRGACSARACDAVVENVPPARGARAGWWVGRDARVHVATPALGGRQGVVPTVEGLVSSSAPLTLVNVTLRHSAWRPGDFVATQSAMSLVGERSNLNIQGGAALRAPVAAVEMVRGHVLNCTFERLGGAGVRLVEGTVAHSTFRDISAGGIVGGTFAPSNRSRRLRIAHNSFSRIGAEYKDAAPILVGHARGATIVGNRIRGAPHHAIAGGWGWTFFSEAQGGNHTIHENFIEGAVTTLDDGGGIYVLGPQPGSAIFDNQIDMGAGAGADRRAGLPGLRPHVYLDDGSRGVCTRNNSGRLFSKQRSNPTCP